MKTMIAILMLMVSTVSFAGERYIDASGLTEQQKAEIALQVAKLKDQTQPVDEAKNISATVREEAEAWGTMGSNMGKAIVAAAREVGVAANDFARTDLGKVTVAVVVYKLIGRDVLGVIVGTSILFTTFSLAIYLMVWFRFGAKKTYEYKPKFWGLYNKRYLISVDEPVDGTVGRFIVAGILIIVGLIVGLNTIF
jgi:hypothetical protein